MNKSKRCCKAAICLLSLFLIVTVVSFLNLGTDSVYADGGAWCNAYSSGDPDEATIQYGTYNCVKDQVVTATIYYNKSDVYIVAPAGVTILSGGNGGDSVQIQFTCSGPSQTVFLTARGTNISGLSVTNYSFSATAALTTTTAPTTRATTAATTRTTTAATTRATTAATTRATTSATTVSASAAYSQNTEAPVTTTTAATTVVDETTETIDASETSETSETDEALPPDGEETEVVVAPIIGGDESDTTTDAMSGDGEGTPTPTPTIRPAVAGTVKPKDKSGFPWWFIICLIIAGVCGYRYNQLSKEDYSGMELVAEFIPGGIIGKVVYKINPSLKPAPVVIPKEDEPVVVNGYLKTSNTKSIRPVYSNAPSTRATRGVSHTSTTATATRPAATSATKAATSATRPAASTTATTPKAPIKRPASASVNRAAATAAAAASTTATSEKKSAATVTPINKVPVQQRPPVKRPSSASVNRAAATAAAASAATATPEATRASVQPRTATKKPESTMNRPDSSALNSNATPTAAAMAFEKAQSERTAAPAIATGVVPPVIEKKDEPKINPFKPIERPTGAEASETTKPEVKAASTSDSYFIPMKNTKKEEVSPFKSATASDPTKPKAPIKRPASASVNRAAATAAAASAAASEASTDKPNGDGRGIVKALGTNEKHTTFRPTEFKAQETIDPFKRPETSSATSAPAAPKAPIKRPASASVNRAAATAAANKPAATPAGKPASSATRPFNAAAAMKEIRAMEESDAAETPKEPKAEPPKRGTGLFDKFKK